MCIRKYRKVPKASKFWSHEEKIGEDQKKVFEISEDLTLYSQSKAETED